MQIKKEEIYHYEDDIQGYVKKYDTKGNLVFEEHYGGGINQNRKITYTNEGKIEKEEIIRSTQSTEGDSKIIKKYEYYKNGYRIYTTEIGKRDFYTINSPEYILEGKEIWEDINNLITIEEFKYKEGKLHSIIKHEKNEGGQFITRTTYTENSFTKKIVKSGSNSIIEISHPDGYVIEKIIQNENGQILKKETYQNDGSIDTTVINEWYTRNDCILQKSKYSAQYFEGDPTWNTTEVKLFNKKGNLIASKHREHDTVTKTIYDNKGNIVNSYTYKGLKSNIVAEILFEYSAEDCLEFEIFYNYSKGKKWKFYTKKIYYY